MNTIIDREPQLQFTVPCGLPGITPTLVPQGHLRRWEQQRPFNRFERLGTPVNETLWADFLLETFEWLTKSSVR